MPYKKPERINAFEKTIPVVVVHRQVMDFNSFKSNFLDVGLVVRGNHHNVNTFLSQRIGEVIGTQSTSGSGCVKELMKNKDFHRIATQSIKVIEAEKTFA